MRLEKSPPARCSSHSWPHNPERPGEVPARRQSAPSEARPVYRRSRSCTREGAEPAGSAPEWPRPPSSCRNTSPPVARLRLVHVSGKEQSRVPRGIMLAPEALQLLACDRFYRSGRPDIPIPVGIVSVERLLPHTQRRGHGLIGFLLNGQQGLLADAFDLVGFECRMQAYIRQQRKRRVCIVAQQPSLPPPCPWWR